LDEEQQRGRGILKAGHQRPRRVPDQRAKLDDAESDSNALARNTVEKAIARISEAPPATTAGAPECARP
jgi:hypothetical protein